MYIRQKSRPSYKLCSESNDIPNDELEICK